MAPSIFETFELVLIFAAVIAGVVSAVYFYLSTDIFMNLLKRPLRFISCGMMIMTLGVMIAAVSSFVARAGIVLVVGKLPIETFFYLAYIIGSIMILMGARQFVHRPKIA